jgi:hypothetical protein
MFEPVRGQQGYVGWYQYTLWFSPISPCISVKSFDDTCGKPPTVGTMALSTLLLVSKFGTPPSH